MGNAIEQNAQNDKRVVTLKEIVDVINIDRAKSNERPLEHSKQMKKVEELMKQPSFGAVAKMSTVYNEQGQKLETYFLTKKQAMAVGAKLDNKRLMFVIDKLEDLTAVKQLTVTEQIILIAQGHTEINERVELVEQKMDDIIANRKIENWQQKALTDAKNAKVYSLAQDDKELATKLHRKVWSLFKKKFHLPRYNELPVSKYEEGLEYISNLTMADLV